MDRKKHNHRDKKLNWMLVFRLIGIALFVFLLFKLDIQEIWKIIKSTVPGYVVLALFLQFIMLLIKALRWQLLKSTVLRSDGILVNMGIFLESYAIGVVTPGRLGEFFKAGYEDSKRDKWKSILRVLAERGFDLGIFIFIAGSALVVYPMIEISATIKYIICATGILLILFAYLLLLNRRSFRLFKESGKLHRLFAHDFNLKAKKVGMIFLLSVISNAATFISCYLLALAVKLGTTFLYTSGGVAVAGLFNLLPITVMGLGTREFTLLYLFNQVDSSQVMAFSFLMFLTLQVGGGLISLLFGQILIYLTRSKEKYDA